MKRSRKVWRLLPHDPVAVDQLARSLNVPAIVARLLLNRGLGSAAEAQRFITGPLTGLHEPELLPGVNEAVERLWAAVQDKRRICVYGDYDVDGVTATAILLTCLKLLGGVVEFHVPHRLDDGYGLSNETLGKLAQSGVQVVVTVDCGIASIEEAEEAKRLGLELLITDHHEPKATLPDAPVLVHPRLTHAGVTYPFGQLSGSGVAFKLAWALCKKACGSPKVTTPLREFLLDAILLASMGTIADVVPLLDENRIFVRHGLVRLRSKPGIGIQALLKQAKLAGKSNLSAVDIGYTLAPRINAAGRLGTARLAVELFTTGNPQRADVLADYLERQNVERQSIERKIMQDAREQADRFAAQPALVLASADWHPGLLGIVASRLVDQFARPVLMIALREGLPGSGSGRSVPGFKLHEALQECTSRLIGHGGHAAAAGFRISPEQIDAFREQFCAVVSHHLGAEPSPHKLVIDGEIQLASLTPGLMQAIEQLEPYGSANPMPLLLADNVQVVGEPRRVGGGERHLSLRVKQNGREVRGVAFGMGDRLEELMSVGGRCSLVLTPRWNEWQGFRSVEIEVKDFQAGPEPKIE